MEDGLYIVDLGYKNDPDIDLTIAERVDGVFYLLGSDNLYSEDDFEIVKGPFSVNDIIKAV